MAGQLPYGGPAVWKVGPSHSKNRPRRRVERSGFGLDGGFDRTRVHPAVVGLAEGKTFFQRVHLLVDFSTRPPRQDTPRLEALVVEGREVLSELGERSRADDHRPHKLAPPRPVECQLCRGELFSCASRRRRRRRRAAAGQQGHQGHQIQPDAVALQKFRSGGLFNPPPAAARAAFQRLPRGGAAAAGRGRARGRPRGRGWR
mmetsp:Transcript_47103/g.106723  ORF Transcript_47103/g.106723 Transcript_47103/m.106723 type:complete len:202 (-) Transcript_47103:389-994(-)